MRGGRRQWRYGLAAVLVLLATLGATVTPAIAQKPKPARATKKGENRSGARNITLVVDTLEKRSWTPDDLRGMATMKWRSRRDHEHPAIPLSAFLLDSGVARERVKELRIRSNSRTVTLRGHDLAQVDGLVLRTSWKAVNRTWRLAQLDRTQNRFDLRHVRRIEVYTSE